MFLRKLHLWPRFESCAKESLDAVEEDIQVPPYPSLFPQLNFRNFHTVLGLSNPPRVSFL